MNLTSAASQRATPLIDGSDQILPAQTSVESDTSDMYEFPTHVVDFATLCSHFTRLVDDEAGAHHSNHGSHAAHGRGK